MTSNMPDGWLISVRFPARGRMRQYQLREPVTFSCASCEVEKTSQLVVTVDRNWSSPICSDCYRKLSTQRKTETANLAGNKQRPVGAKAARPPARIEAQTSASETKSAAVRASPASGVSDAATPPRSESQVGARTTAEQLRKSISRLAKVLRARAEGRPLTLDQRQALAALAGEKVTAAALRFAELVAGGESIAARLQGDPRTERVLASVAKLLALQCNATLHRIHRRHEQRLAEARRPGPAPDYLDALVMRHVAGERFRNALSMVLQRRGLRPDGIDVPVERFWDWLATSRLDQSYSEEALPPEVRRLRDLDAKSFFEVLLADARGTRPNRFLAHPAVVERWAEHAGEVEHLLRRAREHTARILADRSNQRNRRMHRQFEVDAQAYAVAGARRMMAVLSLKELRLRVVRFHGQTPMQRLRAECLNEAAAEVSRVDPELGKLVASTCAEHRVSCRKAKDPHPCYGCAPAVADTVHKRRAGIAAFPVPAVPAPAQSEDPDLGGASTALQAAVDEDLEHDGIFLCERSRKGPPQHEDLTVAVVETRFAPETGRFGYGWLTDESEARLGTGQAAELRDSLVQAMCQAAIDLLGRGKPNVRLVCWGRQAVALLREVLDTGSVPDVPVFPLSERTRKLLAEVIPYGQRISVHAETCRSLHRGAAVAEGLAALALGEERGLETSPQVEDQAEEISPETSDSAGARLVGPDEESDHAWWLTNRPDRLVWQTALYRTHLDGGWCPLPEGELPGKRDLRQRLRLRVEHRDGGRLGPVPTQDVTLRRRGGQWELSGIHWPKGLLPGVIVTFDWPPRGSLVTARTALLPAPERFDDLEFRHRYDPQVVTREIAPGFDQDRDVPDLSDASWVLRTLRKLGYLNADGSATLAENALIRNCLRLGLPKSRQGRIPRAVEQLVRTGRIQRVQGSLDHSDRPWYPARPGHRPADLLRYVPRVETLDVPARREVEDAGHARRRGHWVTGFVRRLPPGAQASPEQLALHREAVYRAEIVDQPLPEGYTYVRRHRRGRSTRAS